MILLLCIVIWKKPSLQIKLGNVLIRSDLNVPINNKKVSDNFRILKAVSYLDELKKSLRT